MKIEIDRSALLDRNGRLRRGLLYGLHRLALMNYRLDWNPDDLTPDQRQLLEQDGLAPDRSENSAEARLSFDTGSETLEIRADDRQLADGEDWLEVTERLLFPRRETELTRKTAETDIQLRLALDGRGESRIDTGLKFFDHMLDQIARHGLIDLDITCRGDLEVDEHHTIEDVAIALGDAIYKLCGEDKTGVQRYGFLLAMDESQAEVALDLSNRPWLVWQAEFNREYVGDFPLEMARHFFHTLAMHMRATLHISVQGENEHHKLEAIFKAFAKALRFSVTRSERAAGLLPSSKGAL